MRWRWPTGLLDSHAIGRGAFLLMVPISAIGVLAVFPAGDWDGHLLVEWVVASVVCTAALGAVLALGSVALRTVHAVGPRQRMIVTVTVVCAAAARGAALHLTLNATGTPDPASLASRTVSSTFFYSIWLILVGLLVSSSARYRESRRELLNELLMRELQMRLLDEDRVRTQRGVAAARVAVTTDEVRELIDRADVDTPDDIAELSRQLRRAIDERVRPMVHDMWQGEDADLRELRPRRAFIRRALLARIPLAWVVPIYAVPALVGAILTMGWQLGVIAASLEVLAVIVVIVMERVLRSPATVGSRMLVLLGLIVLPPLAATLVIGPRVDEPVSILVLLVLGLTAPAVVFATCAARTGIDDRGRTLRELQALLDREEWRDQLDALERRETEHEMASTVHNTVQARLVAASIQLETAALDGDDERARAAIRDARAALDSLRWDQEVPTGSFEHRLASIIEAWQGILTVEVSGEVPNLPETTAHLICDVVEECVANASRHADARHVSVTLKTRDDHIEIEVRDDGRAPVPGDPVAVEGLGMTWMRTVSQGSLQRVGDAHGSVVTLRVPVA